MSTFKTRTIHAPWSLIPAATVLATYYSPNGLISYPLVASMGAWSYETKVPGAHNVKLKLQMSHDGYTWFDVPGASWAATLASGPTIAILGPANTASVYQSPLAGNVHALRVVAESGHAGHAAVVDFCRFERHASDGLISLNAAALAAYPQQLIA